MPIRRLGSTFLLFVILATTPVFGQASVFGQVPDSGRNGSRILERGIEEFQNSEFSQAIIEFRKILVDPIYVEFRGDAYFWVAKATMALGRLDEAEDNLEYFLLNYPAHPNAAEARYQKARLLYLQDEHEAAIIAFERFIDNYPRSPFVANAYYWSGEALFSLGHWARARTLFQTVIDRYPTSFRVEAARYRVSVIELKTREEELLKLLRWSHEESLRTLEELDQRERIYEEALSEYRRRLASLSGEDFKAEIEVLRKQVEELSESLADRNAEISDLESEVATLEAALSIAQSPLAEPSEDSSTSGLPQDEALARELLALKGQALDLKAFYVDWLLRSQEGTDE